MSNHLHLVLRNRPDIAERWSADEIALRWCRLFPPRDDAGGFGIHLGPRPDPEHARDLDQIDFQ